jgi:Zn finger protein HypA/HybF involved in hydrogenase expression
MHAIHDLPPPDADTQEIGTLLACLAKRNAHKLHRCADCTEDLPDDHLHSDLCDECASRRFELAA